MGIWVVSGLGLLNDADMYTVVHIFVNANISLGRSEVGFLGHKENYITLVDIAKKSS
jgi:hypothetical protein